MVIAGLTGSIAMGKTTAAAMLRRLGVPVHDADAAVHRLLGPGGRAVPAVAAAFPGVVAGGRVDRGALGAIVFAEPAALARLERIIHPLVARETVAFLRRWARQRRRLVVLDVPLLLETGGERWCDRVLVVSAPAFLQRQRALARPGMTPAKLAGILARQVPDREKRRRADAVVPTGIGRPAALQAIRRFVRIAGVSRGRRWGPRQAAERLDAGNRPRHGDHRA